MALLDSQIYFYLEIKQEPGEFVGLLLVKRKPILRQLNGAPLARWLPCRD